MKSTEACSPLVARWHGVAALAWLVIGYGVTRLLVSIPALHNPLGLIIWGLLGYFGPALFLAISGLRRGHVADRICASLVFAAFAVLAALVVYQKLHASSS
jgi:hypothetical protein